MSVIRIAVVACVAGAGLLGSIALKPAGGSATDTLLAYGSAGSGMIINIKTPTASGMILRAGGYPMSALGASWSGQEVCNSATQPAEAAIWREAIQTMQREGLIERDWTGGPSLELWRLTTAGHRRAQSLNNFQAVKAEVEAAKAKAAAKWQQTVDRLKN